MIKFFDCSNGKMTRTLFTHSFFKFITLILTDTKDIDYRDISHYKSIINIEENSL